MNHEQHLNELCQDTVKDQASRYFRGAEKYGTKLWEYSVESLIDNAIEENTDQNAYMRTAKRALKEYKERITEGIALIDEGLKETNPDIIRKGRDIIVKEV